MLYRRFVLPRLIDWAMRRDDATRLRRLFVPKAVGVVLEIGIGSGLNLPFYTSAVTRLYGLDPSGELIELARRRASAMAFPVEFFNQGAEQIPLGERSVDTVVVTWSLCSVDDPAVVLTEIRRVLKPGGRFIFVEHGLSPDDGVRKWQNRLTPVWRRCAGGCHLNRPMDTLIRNAGFAVADLRTEYVPGPRPMTFMFEGIAHADHSPGA
jgi:ubiquinone/menaquinone biosynthesis C-methylase UbiE